MNTGHCLLIFLDLFVCVLFLLSFHQVILQTFVLIGIQTSFRYAGLSLCEASPVFCVAIFNFFSLNFQLCLLNLFLLKEAMYIKKTFLLLE